MPTEKYLWLVQYASITKVIQQATTAGISTLVIRTDNDLGTAITLGHAAGLQVYGWRWPSALRSSAMNEAAIATRFFAAGMDGYIVDPEGAPGKPYDWDQPGLESLADSFCQMVTEAAAGRPFGVTSHYLAAAVFPHLPWSTFVGYADLLLPQAYWRVTGGVVGHGDPAENYARALAAWGKLTANSSVIVPMAGELAQVTGPEIATYAAQAAAAGQPCHFYEYTETLSDTIWTAMTNV
jgi:hypothetical protein